MTRRESEKINDGGVELALLGQGITHISQFATLGQLAEPEQVADFFKCRVVGELVNIDAAVGEDTAIAVDITDARGARGYSGEALRGLAGGQAGHVVPLELRRSLPERPPPCR